MDTPVNKLFKDVNKAIDFFFDDPCKKPSNHKKDNLYSVLYLVRRDIQDCFWCEVYPYKEISQFIETIRCKRIFPGILTIFAGIDLLAKFLCGEDDSGGVKRRFKCYLERYFDGLSKEQRDLLWKVRNSLVHSFGLYDKEGRKKIKLDERFTKKGVIIEERGQYHVVHFKNLYLKFERSINRYKRVLQQKQNKNLRNKFETQFSKYAYLRIQKGYDCNI